MKWPLKQTITKRLNRDYLITGLTLFFTAIALLISPSIKADTITRAFNAKQTISPGWVVALSKNDASTVEFAPASDTTRIFGVVIDPNQSPVTLQSQQGYKVFVATSNTYPVLVSTENGPISPGDYLSLSATDGIAAKATSSQAYVLGKALEKFDGHGAITTANGQSIGRISASIAPGKNPLSKASSSLPQPLRRAAESVAGKTVSAIKIYAALAIFIVTATVSSVILYSGIRNGMISLGRNPLSKVSITQGLLQVIVVAVIILIIGVFAVYLLLRI